MRTRNEEVWRLGDGTGALAQRKAPDREVGGFWFVVVMLVAGTGFEPVTFRL